MGSGSVVSFGIERLGVMLPGYIGAMIVAVVIRNLDDRFGSRGSRRPKWIPGHDRALPVHRDGAAHVRLWELAHLALPLVAILLGPGGVLLADVRHDVAIWVMGRNYEAR